MLSLIHICAYPELYDALQAYNAQIFAEGQSGLKDPFAYETPAFDLTGYGLPDDMIAALWIPRLNLDVYKRQVQGQLPKPEDLHLQHQESGHPLRRKRYFLQRG